MAIRMQQRKGTAAQWTASNPILNSGEIGFESDTNKFKIGDGTNLWATLPYFLDEDTIGTSLEGYIPDSLLGANNGVAQLNSSGKLVSTQIPNVDEITQDAINTALVAGTGLDKTYDDNANTITLDIDSTVATLTGTQTLTNKTLTAPVISSITNGAATLTLPTTTGTVALTTDLPSGMVTESATQTLTNKTLTSPTINGATVGGHIIPSTDNTYDLGSPTHMWKDIYVGPGSLYVNGSKVLSDVSGAIVVSADPNENLGLRTSGSGNIELDPTGTGSINIKGPMVMETGSNISNADGNAVTFGGAINADSISSKTANTDLSITANGTGKIYLNDNAEVSGNLVVGGNLTVSGTTTTVNSETISLADNLIDLNSNFTTGTPTENAGIRIMRGDSSAVQFRWNESSDVWEFTTDGTVYNSVLSINDTELTTALGAKLASSTAATTYAPIASPTFTGTVAGITKSMVGLGSVDNTTDANKPVSTATQTALDAKLASATAASTYAPIASPTFTGTVSGVTAAHVGLGSVDNTTDANKPISTATQTALDAKAPLASPALTGTPTAPTATAGTNSTQVATTAYADAAVAALVDAAPGTLNTLNELAAAINDDASYASTITTALGLKAPLASPTFTGTVTLPSATSGANLVNIPNAALDNSSITINGSAVSLGGSTTIDALPSQTSNSGKYLTTNGTAASWATISFPYVPIPVTSVSSNISLTSNNRYFVDTSAARTLTLPASPTSGDEIQIFDTTGSAATNVITVASNSNKINGTVQDLEVDIAYDVLVLVYTGSGYGWVVI